QLGRELDREAVRGLQREGVVGRDGSARGRLVEELHAALERLAETLLLGGERPVDLLAMLGELGIRVAPLRDHGIREAGEERRLHAYAQAVLDCAAYDPAQHVAAALVRLRPAAAHAAG